MEGGGGLSNFLTELTSQARDRPEAMFNLEFKWVVGVGEGEGRGRGGGGEGEEKGEETNFYYPTHPFPLLFLP